MASTASPKNWRDYVWLVFFLLQVPIMLMVDLVAFYPTWIYEPSSSPLHFLADIRTWYKATYNDPFFVNHPPPSWFQLFCYFELVFQLPFSLWSVYKFSNLKKGTTAGQELITMLYALECALTTLTCIHDVLYWDPAVYSWDQKKEFMFSLYGPWFVLRMWTLQASIPVSAIPVPLADQANAPATLMCIDMYLRLLKRTQLVDVIKKTV